MKIDREQATVLDNLHSRAGNGEMLAVEIRELAAGMGAGNAELTVKLFPGGKVGQVEACVIDPATGQCINYFSIPDESGSLLSTILRGAADR